MITEKNNVFYLETPNTEYIFAVHPNGTLQNEYWGARIGVSGGFPGKPSGDRGSNDPVEDFYTEEYSAWGGARFKECALKVSFADGNRDLKLHFASFALNGETLDVVLKDDFYALWVTLHYAVFPENDVIRRSVSIRNETEGRVTVERIASAVLHLPGKRPFRMHNVSGAWAGEQQPFSETLQSGSMIFESRKGSTAHGNSPYCIAEQGCAEFSGDAYFAALEYSGNFKVCASRGADHRTQVLLGINDFDFAYILDPHESLDAPPVFFGFTEQGFSGVSNTVNRFALDHIFPKTFAEKPLPVLYNSWEALEFSVNIENQTALVQKAADMGIELFVMDDGWFGARKNDRAGLGDWFVNREKFPDGLAPLIDCVNRAGMDFGLWVEPEMVNPDSDLYRAHPDWVYHFPNRKNRLLRSQLVLNLTLDEVQDYLYDCLSTLLRENNIRYIKWDMNRAYSEAGAPNLGDNQKAMWYLHNRALFALLERLRTEFPAVSFEACASGGGRIDYGALHAFDMYWPSDNTEAVDRIRIQNGYSRMYPTKAMRAWVTDIGWNALRVPLDFRFACAMRGALSVGGNIGQWSQEELDTAAQYIALYKSVRDVIQFGDFYRIADLDADEGLNAVQYVSCDKTRSVAILLTPFTQFHLQRERLLFLRGLDDQKTYRFTWDGETLERTGAFLNHVPLTFETKRTFDCRIVVLEAVEPSA